VLLSEVRRRVACGVRAVRQGRLRLEGTGTFASSVRICATECLTLRGKKQIHCCCPARPYGCIVAPSNHKSRIRRRFAEKGLEVNDESQACEEESNQYHRLCSIVPGFIRERCFCRRDHWERKVDRRESRCTTKWQVCVRLFGAPGRSGGAGLQSNSAILGADPPTRESLSHHYRPTSRRVV